MHATRCSVPHESTRPTSGRDSSQIDSRTGFVPAFETDSAQSDKCGAGVGVASVTTAIADATAAVVGRVGIEPTTEGL